MFILKRFNRNPGHTDYALVALLNHAENMI